MEFYWMNSIVIILIRMLMDDNWDTDKNDKNRLNTKILKK